MTSQPQHLDHPPGTRIACKHDPEFRALLIGIEPGSNRLTRDLGRLVLTIVSFCGAVTVLAMNPQWLPECVETESGAEIIVFPVIWLMNLWLVGYWIVGRFTRVLLRIQGNELLIRKELFGLASGHEYRLPSFAKARTSPEFGLEQVCVHAIVIVVDTGRSPRFGALLLPEEKEWIVDRINVHLGKQACPPEILGEYKEQPQFNLSTKGEWKWFGD